MRLAPLTPRPRAALVFVICAVAGTLATQQAQGAANSIAARKWMIAATRTSPTAPGTRVIVSVGATLDNYPYSFIGPDGRLEGFAVDLFDAVARYENLRIRRVLAPGSEIANRFYRGEVDALQVFSQSPEREALADFSAPYFTLESCIFVRAGSAVKQLSDLNGQRFAIVGLHSTGERFLRDHHLATTIVYVNSAEEALRAVGDGGCAATFLSQLTAVSVIEHSHLRNVVILGTPNPGYDVLLCFAVRRGNTELLTRLNEGLAIVRRSGAFDQIYRKWYGRFDSPLFTREQVIRYVLTILALSLAAAIWAYLQQRRLLRKVRGQAAELAGQRALLQALYDHIPTAMVVLAIEPDGPRIISLNREAGRFYGIEPEAAVDRTLALLPLAPTARQHLEEVLRRQPADDQIVHYEFSLTRDRRVLAVTIIPLSHDPAGPPRLCVLAEDVTARKQLDAEVAQSRKLRAVGELVGGIAHEFNNLLTPIMLKVGEIQLDWSQDAKLQQEMDVIAKTAQRAAELTRRLLTFGRKTETRPEAVQIEAVVAGCFDLLRHTVDRRIVWERNVPADLPPLQFNSTDLNQILLNLLLNARDTLMEKLVRTPDAGWVPTIHVAAIQLPLAEAKAARPEAGRVLLGWQQLTVRDNGVGIPPEVAERIFEPFFTTKEVGKGTGLGLATVWHLVTHGGGRVELESIPGSGTAFHIFLPVWAQRESSTPKRREAEAPNPSTATVLLVEDEPLVAAAVAAVLERYGHRVRTIADGTEAWRHLSGMIGAYDLLVIDVNLPGMTGIDLIGHVRTTKFGGRILIMSGRLAMPELRTLAQLQVDRVLTKPFTVEQLDHALRECLSSVDRKIRALAPG